MYMVETRSIALRDSTAVLTNLLSGVWPGKVMTMLKRFLALAILGLPVTATAGTVTYIYTDPQGTPLAETDASGTVTATFDYRPYGAPALGGQPNGPGYTGHVNDADTSLVYMQARYYDGGIGRFVSRDPMPPKPGELFNFNGFDYGNNNPIENTDPTGRQVDRTLEEIMRRQSAACLSDAACLYALDGDKEGSKPSEANNQSHENSKDCDDDDSCVVARAVGGRLVKMGGGSLIKKLAPGGLSPWLGVLSRAITAAKRAKDWGMVFAQTNDTTLKDGIADIRFYKDSETIPPTGRMYYDSVINWGKVDWGVYDNKSYSLPPEMVWDNFVHDNKQNQGGHQQ